MKPVLFSTLFLLASGISFSQEDPIPETKTQFTIDGGFSGIQLGAELKTGKTQTVLLRSGLLPFIYTEFDFANGKDELNLTGSLALIKKESYHLALWSSLLRLSQNLPAATLPSGQNQISIPL